MVGSFDMAYTDRQLLLDGKIAKIFDCGRGIRVRRPVEHEHRHILTQILQMRTRRRLLLEAAFRCRCLGTARLKIRGSGGFFRLPFFLPVGAAFQQR